MAIKCPKCDTDNPETVKFCGECGTQLPSSEDIQVTETMETPREELTTGSTFAGRYQIIEELGKGGMGRVYRALDRELNEEIAIKLIKPEIAQHKKSTERFKSEIKLARKVSHKNIGRVHELMEEKGIRFITMEYVPGEDLKSFIRRSGQLAVGTTIRIAKQVCEGLAEAHKVGIVHRDLKPNNIIIDKEGNARIMDFGIARSLESKGITGAGVMIGTPEYMSPEQVEGKDVDQRSDIYSLGVILYEMVTGRVPFEGNTPFTVGVKQKSESPQNPKEINPQIPEDLNSVILKCLKKEKLNRYQSAGEVRSQLDLIEKGMPTTERKAPEKKPLTSKEITLSFSTKRLLIPALLILAVVIAAVFFWKPWAGGGAAPTIEDKASLAVLYFKNNTGDETLNNWRTALSDSIITDLSQSRYFEVLPSDRIFGILRKLNLEEAGVYATEDLKKVAAEGGVNHILTGSLSKAGEVFRIDYLIQEIPTGQTRGSDRVEGQGEASIFSMVDQITKNIKQDFNLSQAQITGDVDREVGTITTASAEAFKYYSEGRQAHNSGEYEKSIALMERAVAVDPEFAMAYRSMAMAYGNIRLHGKGDEYIKKAFDLSDRLPDRERYIIQADFYRQSSTTYDKALQIYDKLLELYPDDRIASNNSALIYNSLEQWDKAAERYKISVQRKDPSVLGYGNLASVYTSMGRHEEAVDLLRSYIEDFQDNAGIRANLADTYISMGELDQALVEIDKAFSLNPTDWSHLYTKGSILYLKGDLEASRRVFEEMEQKDNPGAKAISKLGYLLLDILRGKLDRAIDYSKKAIAICQSYNQKGWEVNFHMRLIDMYSLVGKREQALNHYQQGWEIAVGRGSLGQQRLLLVGKGVNFLQIQSIDDALATARELKESVDSGLNEKAMRVYDYLMGLIELEKGNSSAAIKHLSKGKSLLPAENDAFDAHAIYSFALGQAYHRRGDLDRAQAAYMEIFPMTGGRVFFPELYVLAHLELGKVFQDQGDTSKAIEYYEKFLDFWKDADPGLPGVEDAKKRLAGLKR
ncbi:MAG: protein kinase [Candidatus Aminicenantes bacterium]|jgi:serine/threonine protein kinase/tetratricopeptide (TPR) repeat protein